MWDAHFRAFIIPSVTVYMYVTRSWRNAIIQAPQHNTELWLLLTTEKSISGCQNGTQGHSPWCHFVAYLYPWHVDWCLQCIAVQVGTGLPYWIRCPIGGVSFFSPASPHHHHLSLCLSTTPSPLVPCHWSTVIGYLESIVRFTFDSTNTLYGATS